MVKAAAPRILTANDLLEGDVVFLGHGGWVRDHRAARVARNAEEAAAIEALGAEARAARQIIDPYLIEVSLEADGTPAPLRYRERLRTLGPTVRPDLGKQAERSARRTS